MFQLDSMGGEKMLEALIGLYPEWKFEEGDPSELQPVDPTNPLRCVEDRMAAEGTNLAPALPGGVVSVASAIAREAGATQVESGHVEEANYRLSHAGLTPGAHDLEPFHCGRFGLAVEGKLPGELPWGVSPVQVGELVEAAGGAVQHMLGEHNPEAILGINFVPNTTRPADGTQFQNDVWVGALPGVEIDPMSLVDDGIKTIENLGMPKIGVVWE